MKKLILFFITSFLMTTINVNGQYVQLDVISDVAQVSTAGDVINFTITVNNNSNDALVNSNITGAAYSLPLQYISGDVDNNTIIDASESWIYESVYTLTQNDIDVNGIPFASGFVDYEVSLSYLYSDLSNAPTILSAVEVVIVQPNTDVPPTCGGIFVDSGNTNGNYSNNEDVTTTICPDITGDAVTVTFISFNTESGYDNLKIYDGNDATATLLGEFDGTDLPPTFTASTASGCLTFVFHSDVSSTRLGWEANVTCAPLPTCLAVSNLTEDSVTDTTATISWTDSNFAQQWEVETVLSNTTPTGNGVSVTSIPYTITGLMESTLYDVYIRADCDSGDFSTWTMLTFDTDVAPIIPPACGGIFIDSGNTNGNYSSNEDTTTAICPDTIGDAVTVTFTSFNTETGYDNLKIYDGNDASATLLGEFDGTDLPPTFTASTASGCLTFVFHSDGSVTRDGWEANVTCAPLPTCLEVSNLTEDSVTDTTATISWVDNNNTQQWEVETVLSNTTPTGNGVVVTSMVHTITDLLESTLYDVYVRADCGAGDFSAWSMLTFDTVETPCYVPTGNEQQVFDATTNPTVADIVVQTSVQGEIVLIFDVADCNATPLDLAMSLSNGATYYAFQGACCDEFLTIEVELNIPVMDYPYDVAPIPFQIYGQPLPDTMNMDDGYTDLIPLTFNFNYFGFNYNQISIGTNSVISFDTSDAGLFCDWDINADNTIPSSQTIDNAILGAYQDYDNRGGMAGAQGYGFVGTAPFRKFVVFFDDVELYNTSICTGIRSTNQMILYESYDYIDVQVQDRNVCTAWNEGNAIIGIQNIGGTEAYFPADRNVGNWEAHNEGYRFKPNYNMPDFQFIICDVNVDGLETFDLTGIVSEFNASAGSAFDFYETLADAEAFANPISMSYTNTSNAQTIYLRIDDSQNGLSIKRILLATIDCNADYDLDTIPTTDEDLNNNGNYGDDDTDGDAIPDFIDEDDDGDFVLTTVEAVVTTNKDTLVYLDTDGDQIPNYLDNDDDGDGMLTINEDYDGDMNPGNDDTNGDGIPDYMQQSVALGVNEISLSEFTIYPNPVLDVLTVDFASLQNEVTIKIFSLQGQEVYVKLAITDNTTQIDISNLSSGVYFVNVLEENKVSVQKFVKK